MNAVFFFAVTDIHQAIYKSVPHGSVWKFNFGIHGESIKVGKFSQLKPGKPPVNPAAFEKNLSVFTEDKAHIQTFIVRGAVVIGSGELLRLNIIGSGIVNADFSAGCYSVLAFP